MGEVEHGVRTHDAGPGVALGRSEDHVEVAEIACAERLDDARAAEHARHAHRAHGFADAVDRDTEERDAAHDRRRSPRGS